MQFPIDLVLGPIAVPSHLLFEILAYVVGFRYYLSLREKSEDVISEDNRLWILIGGAFGALVFSRLVGSLENPEEWFSSRHPLLYFYQNKTIMGGLAGGLLGVELIKLFIGEKSSSGDLFTLPLIVAIIIGRIGCFLTGVKEPTYGNETTVPWGMNLGDGALRHPTALYEIIFLFILWRAIQWVESHRVLRNGDKFKVFMICYFCFRFMIEFIKPVPMILMGLSTIQLLCIGVLLYYLGIILRDRINAKQLVTHV